MELGLRAARAGGLGEGTPLLLQDNVFIFGRICDEISSVFELSKIPKNFMTALLLRFTLVKKMKTFGLFFRFV